MVSGLCLFSSVRADGLQGEFMASQYWRDLNARYSPHTNPAFLSEENYLSLRMAEALVLQTFNLTEIGITLPVGLRQSWGFSYFGQGAGAIKATSSDLAGDSIRDGGASFSDMKNFFMLSYANALGRGLSIGGNLALSYETNFSDVNARDQISACAGDVGLSYRMPKHPVLGEHLLGLSLQNVLAPFGFGQFSYANNIRLAWLGNYWNRRIESWFEIETKNFYGALFRDHAPRHVEYAFAARVGGNMLQFLNVYAQAGSNYFGFAGGVNVPRTNGGYDRRDYAFLYQYLIKTNAEADALHTFYLRAQFGPHRRQAYDQRMARIAAMRPNDLYVKACNLYYAGKYWDALWIFSQILVGYPDFFKNDQVSWYTASCREKLDMRETAAEGYNRVVQSYANSSVVPQARLGLMRIQYRDGAASQAMNGQFQQLNRTEVADSIKAPAYYLMAETFFREKQYRQAAELFAQIPPSQDEYPFAQHSLAVIHIINADTVDAVSCLGNCIKAPAATAAQREIANRSIVCLGYLYYEQNELSQAVATLRQVPPASYYYEDALSGLCWAAMRAHQWDDCITIGQELQRVSQRPVLQCDGALVEGYANMVQKKYKEAYAILTNAQMKAAELSLPSADTLQIRNDRYVHDRKDYDALAAEVNVIASQPQSSAQKSMLDSLHRWQEDGKAALDGFAAFTCEYSRQSLFARNVSAVKGDIDYMLAICTKQQSPEAVIQEKMASKQKELDAQIAKLKKEMGNLDNDKHE
jgi:TolA-binding protein